MSKLNMTKKEYQLRKSHLDAEINERVKKLTFLKDTGQIETIEWQLNISSIVKIAEKSNQRLIFWYVNGPSVRALLYIILIIIFLLIYKFS